MGKNCEASRSHKCEKCGYLGHFELCCHSRKRNEERGRGPNRRQSRVHAVAEEEGDDEYVFVVGVNKSDSTPKFCVSVDGVDINILADTGAKINIIDEVTFLEMQASLHTSRHKCNPQPTCHWQNHTSDSPTEFRAAYTITCKPEW